MNAVRGDGVGIEASESMLRAIRLRHDVPGRVAAAAELPFVAYDDNAALDTFVLLRAELGEPDEPTRLAVFPPAATLQRIDVTGKSGPELNDLRSTLDRRHSINSTVVVDDGPRRWLLLIRWDASAVRRLEDLAARAGFVDVTIEPSPVALARVLTSSTTYLRRLAGQADAHHAVVRNGLPVAAAGTAAPGRTHPDIDVNDVDVPSAWFDDMLGQVQLVELMARVDSSAQARDAFIDSDSDRSAGNPGNVLTLGIAGEAYPAYPPHDIRAAARQGVAIGAAAGAAGLAGSLRPVDMIIPAISTSGQFDRPWAVERMSDIPEAPAVAPTGTIKRMTRLLRPRKQRT